MSFEAREIRVLSFASAVCKRPCMYTATGNLAEVLAFFVGFECAQQQLMREKLEDRPSRREQSPSQVLDWWCNVTGMERIAGTIGCAELVERLQAR